MNLNASLFMQCIVFFTLALLTMKYIWPPLIAAIDDRRQKIADGLAAAERGAQEQIKAEASAQALLVEANRKAAEVVAFAQKQANELVQKSRDEAKLEGDKQIKLAEEQILLEQNKAKDYLRQQVVALSLAGAERIIKKEIDSKMHAKLMDDLIKQI